MEAIMTDDEKSYIWYRQWESAYIDQAGKNFFKVSALLHRNNPEMILFIYPDKECFRIVMVNATSGGPKAARVRRL